MPFDGESQRSKKEAFKYRRTKDKPGNSGSAVPRRMMLAGAIRKFLIPLAAFALMAVVAVGVPSLTMAQEPGVDGPSNRVVVDANEDTKGKVLVTGEKVEGGCDFGDEVQGIEIVGTPSLAGKSGMVVSVGPNAECQLVIGKLEWKSADSEDVEPGASGPAESRGYAGNFLGDSLADWLGGDAIQTTSGTSEYEAWARGWWRDGIYLRLTETNVEFVYYKNGSNVWFEGTNDHWCDELSTHWRTDECTDGVLPANSSSIGRYTRGYFRTISPIADVHPLMANHSIKTDLKTVSNGIHIRCLTSHTLPDAGVWPFTAHFECDGDVQLND